MGRAAGAGDDRPQAALGGGFRYIAKSPVLPTLIGLAFVPILLGMPYQTLMPVFALKVFDVGSTGLGTLLMLAGLGALGGSLAVAALADFPRKALLQIIAVVSFGFLLYHAVTFFVAAPQALVVHLGRKRVPANLVLAGHYAAWAVASAVVFWLLVR